MGGVLIKVLGKDGLEIDRTHLVEGPWHVLMPSTISSIIKEMTTKHKWFKIEIMVL